jgi:hypothetical protein
MQLVFRHRPFTGEVPEMPDNDWPRNDHEEPDAGVAQEKIASGFFSAAEDEEPTTVEPAPPSAEATPDPAPSATSEPEPAAESSSTSQSRRR